MRRFSVVMTSVASSLLLAATAAHAQAIRTWVSGVGDDANPCSRTAPCKTFAGAISRTAAGGEISVLDPGGFGAVTITKSISIVADGSEGGLLASATNGVIINAATTDVVTLKGLTIEGGMSGLNGVRILAAGAVHIEDCIIRGFNATSAGNGHGIALLTGSGATEMYVVNTTVEKNGAGSNGGGILVKPSGPGAARVVLDNARLNNNVFGIKADGTGSTGGIKVTVFNSTSAGNGFSGFTAVTPGGGAVVNMMISDSASTNNGTTGVLSDGAAATVRIGGNTITGNATGLQSNNAGVIASYGNNRVNGNGAEGAPTAILGEN